MNSLSGLPDNPHKSELRQAAKRIVDNCAGATQLDFERMEGDVYETMILNVESGLKRYAQAVLENERGKK